MKNITKSTFLKKIKAFFKENDLDLEKPKQFVKRNEKAKIKKLQELALVYQRLFPEHGRQKCNCQRSINEVIIVLQLYVKKNDSKPE